eukprot:2506889-Alexandrium_andersonii.AAC.1
MLPSTGVALKAWAKCDGRSARARAMLPREGWCCARACTTRRRRRPRCPEWSLRPPGPGNVAE